MSDTKPAAWFLLALVLALPLTLNGQGSSTAAIRGVVTDPSGAVVPAAKVSVRDVARGTEFRAQSDEQGRYVLAALPPSTYTLTVEAAAFRVHRLSEFILQVQQQATIDVALAVGDVATAVDVTSTQPLLNTTIANLGQVIDNRSILQLPSVGRSALALTLLAPGVVNSGGRLGPYDSRIAAPFDVQTSNFSSNGSRNSTSEVTLDGVAITGPEINGVGALQMKYEPSVDAVQEFKVQTNFFSAEYGQSGTAVINMVTKSGTNALHGTGYYFFRDSVLNANSFFSNRAGVGRPAYRRHQPGGVLGGPIKRNKAFFFATYERTDATTPSERAATFPTLLQQRGDFSDYMNPQGRLIQIFNPFDTYRDAQGAIKRRPFPSNTIPRSMQDPIALNVSKFLPAPNQPGTPFTLQNNFFTRVLDSTIDTKSDAKVDLNLSSNNRLTGRFSIGPGKFAPGNLLGEGNPAESWNWGTVKYSAYNTVSEFTRTHGPSTIITFRFGFMHTNFDRGPLAEFTPSQLGLPKLIDQTALCRCFPRFDIEGYNSLGYHNAGLMGRVDNAFSFAGSVTKIIGGHNIKIGGEFRHFMLDYRQGGAASTLSFNRQVTSEDRFASNALQGNGFASMLLGWGGGGQFFHTDWAYSRARYAGFYIQDDWKITRKLTLNLGLRYDFDVPRWEKYDRYSYWDLDKPSPINGKVPGFDLRGVYQFVGGENPRSPLNGDYNNLGPRIGLAYAVNDRTAIRAGLGAFYTASAASVAGRLGSGFLSTSGIEWTRDANETRYATLANPYPDGLTLPQGSKLGESTFLGLGADPDLRENRSPEYYSWNLSIQRQLAANSLLEINYTGNRGTHQLMANDASLNRLPPEYWSLGRTELNRLVPNPFYGVITDPRSLLSLPTTQRQRLLRPMPQFTGVSRGYSPAPRGNSIYHALQVRWEKRLSRGLTTLAHYTWAKMIDDGFGGRSDYMGGGTSIQDWFNLRNERSLSAHDIAHRFLLTANYQLPIGTGRALGTSWGRLTNALLGGWEISGIWQAQTGAPLQVTQAGGVVWDAGQRPNLTANPDPGLGVKEKFNRLQYFNPAAFSQPPSDVLGTAPRTLGYRGPHFVNLDAALLKSFAIKEGMRAEFRCELDNATNVVTFGTPNTSFGSTAFGIINDYAVGRGPRNIQVAVKFYF